MAEKITYVAERVCNVQLNRLGLKGSDIMRAVREGTFVCPLQGASMTGEIESPSLFSPSEQLLRLAKEDATNLVDGWVDDPCKVCKVPAVDGGIKITNLDESRRLLK